MKSRPKRFVVLSLFLAAIAASFPVQVMLLFDRLPWEVTAVANLLTPVNWLVIGLCLLSAGLALRASPWLFASLPLLAWLVIYNNWLVGRAELSYNMTMTALGSVFFAAVLAGLIDRPMLHAMLNPQSRWWLTPRRAKRALPLRMRTPTSGDVYLQTYDLSEGGAFIPVQQAVVPVPVKRPRSSTARVFALPAVAPAAEFVERLPIGAQCYVSLPLAKTHSVQCRAEVVRTTQGHGEYPAGVGIRFLGLSAQDRRLIQQYLAQEGLPC